MNFSNLISFGGGTLRPRSKIRIQAVPNLVRPEKRICLTRIRWERGQPGVPGGGYSAKLSVSICFVPQDCWLGIFWKGPQFPSAGDRFTAWICLLPCLPIRIKLIKTWGGIIP